MKEFYYLTGKDKHGPHTVDELKKIGLSGDNFVWTEGMESWKKLKDVPELFNDLYSKIPPPLPIEVIEETDDTPIKYNRLEPKEIKRPSLKALPVFIFWCSLHLFALLMSYTGIDFFNTRKPKTDEFWPFVKFTYNFCTKGHEYFCVCSREEKKMEFHGIFFQYDWTEFSFYIGIAIVIFLLLKISNRDTKATN